VSLLVVDVDAEEFYRQHDITVTASLPNVITIQTPAAAVGSTDHEHNAGE